jgi:hypothetical protein
MSIETVNISEAQAELVVQIAEGQFSEVYRHPNLPKLYQHSRMLMGEMFMSAWMRNS